MNKVMRKQSFLGQPVALFPKKKIKNKIHEIYFNMSCQLYESEKYELHSYHQSYGSTFLKTKTGW